jgi:plasmid stabilization system protein ParE
MSTYVRFVRGTQDDIDEAYIHYEGESIGLGDKFLADLKETVSRIVDNPLLYAKVFADVRAAMLRQFKFVVFFRYQAETVVIVAIQHGSRRWSRWRRRLDN